MRISALLLSLFWGLLFYGLIDLLAFAQGPDFHTTVLLSTGWGLVFLFLVAAPLAAVAVRPAASSAALQQVALVAVAVAAGAALSASPSHLIVAIALALTVAVLAGFAGGRGQLAPRGWRWSWTPGAVVIVSAVPWCAYAWTSARATGSNPVADDTWGLDHWPVQAALPLAFLLVSALAAGHPSGWALPTWCVGAAAGWFAVVCWTEPHLAGSVSRPWAAAVFLWALTFVAATYLSAPRPGRPSG
jgi:hypothetical protein